MPKYIVVPITYPWNPVDSAEEAKEVAVQRIQKNQQHYGGARVDHTYAICRVEAIARPIRPVVDVEIISEE